MSDQELLIAQAKEKILTEEHESKNDATERKKKNRLDVGIMDQELSDIFNTERQNMIERVKLQVEAENGRPVDADEMNEIYEGVTEVLKQSLKKMEDKSLDDIVESEKTALAEMLRTGEITQEYYDKRISSLRHAHIPNSITDVV